MGIFVSLALRIKNCSPSVDAFLNFIQFCELIWKMARLIFIPQLASVYVDSEDPI